MSGRHSASAVTSRTEDAAGRHRVRKVKGRRWSTRARVTVAFLDVALMATAAIAVTNWTVGLDAGSAGQGKASSVTNLAITATSTPSPTNLLYPGGTGDVVISIANPNPFPVTITAVNLPTNTTYADGYSDSGLSSTVAGCAAGTPSGVTWSYATGSSGSSHTLTAAMTVGASGASNNPLVVTLTNAASMSSSAPAACVSNYFKMPSFTGISATGGAATSTTTPATSSWTS